MQSYSIVELKNGLKSVRALEENETFHPGLGPQEEARILHVEQQRLKDRSMEHAIGHPTEQGRTNERFEIWDVGLGAAGNAITTIDTLLEAPHELKRPTSMHSFDKTTAALEFAYDHAEELGYFKKYLPLVRELLDNGNVRISETFDWVLHLGDFRESISTQKFASPHAIIFDPYSSLKNTEMWSVECFSKIYSLLDPQQMCTLTNYSNSTYVRVTLLLSGFYVGTGSAIGKKEQTTIASNQLHALQRPLSKQWLEKRVTASHSAAPVRGASHKIAPLSKEDLEALRAHPQFR